MEEGFFDGPTGDRPTTDAPPPGDEGHARMTRLTEAAVVLIPVCKAVRTVDPTPAQDEEDNTAQAGWPVKCRKFMVIGVKALFFFRKYTDTQIRIGRLSLVFLCTRC
jgi:hypothetical protein